MKMEMSQNDIFNADDRLPIDATTEWCLTFKSNLSEIEIDDSTHCMLHGRIVWQDLGRHCGLKIDSMANVCRQIFESDDGSDVLSEGIKTTIGELRTGQVNAKLTLEYDTENRQKRVSQGVSCQKIAKAPLRAWLKTLQNKIREGKIDDTPSIALGSLTKNSSFFEQRSLKYKAALAAARGISMAEVPQTQVYEYLVRDILDRKEYISLGSSAKISLFNSYGEMVDSKTLVAVR